MLELQNELNRDIFLSDKAIKNKSSSTKIKARNFLTNVSYNRITTADYKNQNFVVDCFTFLILHLNPFYLERKFESIIEREFVNTLWTFLMPINLCNYITKNENMTTLIKIKVKYHDARNIILKFVQDDKDNLNVLSDFLEKNGTLYQFLYGNLFPKCFSRISDYGVKAKTLFNTYYQNFNVQKKIINWQNKNIKEEEEEKAEQEYNNTTPINMTTLYDDDDDDDDDKKSKETNKKKRKTIDNKTKEEKREVKKQKLLQQLNENTEKLKKLKKKK